MKFLLIILIFCTTSFKCSSQEKFRLTINTTEYIGDSIFFGGLEGIPAGFSNLYNFKLSTNSQIKKINDVMEFEFSVFNLILDKKTMITGSLEYPIPVNFLNMKEDCMPCISRIFFIENKKMEISLPKMNNKFKVLINSPTNKDYNRLKSRLSKVYVNANNPLAMDSLIDFKQKQEIMKSYIQKYPSSYAALWEIIFDYSDNSLKPNYQDNLKYFSEAMKGGLLYKRFLEKLELDNLYKKGDIMPNVNIENGKGISLEMFGNKKLTLINYWSTTCSPCIKSLPQIVELRKDFLSQGFDVIGISDDKDKDRINLAKKILIKNNADWTNFFDLNNEFRNKLNVNVFPIYFLVDSQGKIILRELGNYEVINNRINEYFKKNIDY